MWARDPVGVLGPGTLDLGLVGEPVGDPGPRRRPRSGTRGPARLLHFTLIVQRSTPNDAKSRRLESQEGPSGIQGPMGPFMGCREKGPEGLKDPSMGLNIFAKVSVEHWRSLRLVKIRMFYKLLSE